jgi:hypothetical protein
MASSGGKSSARAHPEERVVTTTGIETIIYPVRDLARVKVRYGTAAGVEPVTDEPYYVGYRVDGQDIGLDRTAMTRA